MSRSIVLFFCTICCVIMLDSPLPAVDWPQYRGVNRDDVSTERGLLKEWPATGPKLLWTFSACGVGYSPPATKAERAYVTGGRDDTEYLIAIDTEMLHDGAPKEVWSVAIGPTFRWKGNSWSAGPSATPTIDGDLIFAIGGHGDLIAVSVADGKMRWRTHLGNDLGGQVNPIGGGPKDLGWGFTASPLIDGEQLICVPGGVKGTLAALDKRTGRIMWRSTELTDQAAYTSPMMMETGGVKQYVILTNTGLAGVSSSDGRLLWRHRRQQNYGTEVINTPLIRGNLIYTTVAAGNGGCEMIRIDRDAAGFKPISLYANKNLMNHHGNVVLIDSHIYGFGQGSGWCCQDMKSGEILWSERKHLRSGALTYADGKLYCYAEDDGSVALIDASPDGWKESGRFKLPKSSQLRQPQGKIWTPPIVTRSRLLLRDQEFMFCYDLKAP